MSILTAYVIGKIDEKLNNPSVSVNVSKQQKEISLHISSTKSLETLAIDLPILGKVINIHDNNPVTDAQTSKYIVGEQTNLSQNNVEFLIENLKENTSLEYKILFDPMPSNIFIAGTDRYKLSFSWYYNGNLRTKTQWISLKDGKEIDKPNIIVKGATIYKRVLTPEEIKRLYQEGLKKRKIE